MIGPVSTPASAQCTVQPVTFTPYASASRTPWAPGNEGSSAGWVLRYLPPNASMKSALTIRMNPEDTTTSGAYCCSAIP